MRLTPVSGENEEPNPFFEVVEVPDLVGKSVDSAQGVLDTVGLELYLDSSPELDGDPDLIVQQLPQAGQTLLTGSLVVKVPSAPIRQPTLTWCAPWDSNPEPAD